MLPIAPTSRAFSYLCPSNLITPFLSSRLRRPFSFSSASRYPLYYELVRHRPSRPHPRPSPPAAAAASPHPPSDDPDPMDRSKRKYYRKREKRMYGGSASDSDAPVESDYVELQPEIVDFPRLHAREQELYFHDAFAFPWEKDKHYRMVYQLEKKFFPDQCLDKAFVDPVAPSECKKQKARRRKEGGEERDGKSKVKAGCEEEGGEEGDEKAMIFFDEEKEKTDAAVDRSVSEKKVEEFFKCLKKVPNATGRGGALAVEDDGEPYLVTRRTELPPRWDGSSGTVVLVDKPKGWTSFTVCGKLRRLVKVQKVGHAGTLDPMATGLLVVCVGKATKVVDRHGSILSYVNMELMIKISWYTYIGTCHHNLYQGMTKGYSGVFRLGEATSTWDADSPVILREPWEHIRDDDIKRTVTSFLGEIWQVPPMFSAIKVGGEKMYDKARRGEMIELSPRRISIFQFDIERSLEDRQNLIFRVTCSKGTYIRSLCADFGKALGSCAHLTSLRRDSIGEYSADDAWNFRELEEKITKAYL